MAGRRSGITLQQLQYFIEVAAEGSISAASDLLYVAQPTMSAAMKDLEARVGRDLLVRSARGVTLTTDGVEFLGYARQVVEQAELLEQRYLGRPPSRRLLGVSTQHYSFAVDAFVRMVRSTGSPEYEFSLRETRTWDIIEDVRTLRSEIGILFRNDFNRNVIDKLLRDSGLASALISAAPFTGLWLIVDGIALSTVLVFDVGVYLAVFGAILTLVFALEESI